MTSPNIVIAQPSTQQVFVTNWALPITLLLLGALAGYGIRYYEARK